LHESGKPKRNLKRAGTTTKKRAKRVRSKKIYSLRTRSSPHQLYNCIKGLTEKQRKIVKQMGFEKLLMLNVNGIPGKLGYFVVDNFNPEKMEIRFGKIAIKVDKEAIQQLLGVSDKGVSLICSEEELKETTPLAEAYKNRHDRKATSGKKIVRKIQETEDDDDLMFKIDFIVLFVNTIIECHLNGLCKTGFVIKLTEDMDFKNIDWCSFILHKIKDCKKDWVPKDLSSWFRGALTILVV
jgi:hypothetical protein